MNPEVTVSPAWTEWVYEQIAIANRAASGEVSAVRNDDRDA